jgi:hypothetical protein
MKLTKLLMGVVFAVAAMAFVACDNDTPTPPVENKEYALVVTSDAVMEFPAEGGEGAIEWTLNEVTRFSSTEQPEPVFTTDAEWIVLLADDLGAFSVAVNEGEAREAVITITYVEQVESVTVKQAAAAPAPIETVELASAVRLSSAEFDLPLNSFLLLFADEAETLELGFHLVGAEGDEVLQAGTYTIDNGGVDAVESALQVDDVVYNFTEGVVVVELNGEEYSFDIIVTTDAGEPEELHFVYAGEVENMVQNATAEPVAFVPASVKAERYMIGNFFLQLYIDGVRYHELDMYDEVAPNDDLLSAGLYTYAAETISTWSTYSTGNDQTCAFADAEITLVHNEDNTTTITGFIKSEEGDHITIDWTGVVEGFVYEKETGKEFAVEALSAKVEYDKEGQKDLLFMVEEFVGHKFSFKGEGLQIGKPLADGEYSSEAATIDLAYCVHSYGGDYGEITAAKATVVNNLDEGTTAFVVEWQYEGNTYIINWSGAVEGVNYGGDVAAEPLDFAPVYVEMVKVSSNDRYFYFYDKYENELVVNLWNGKLIMPYINYEGAKLDIDTENFTFEYSDNGLGKEDGLYTYNVRLVTLDGRLIEFKGNILTYYSNN